MASKNPPPSYEGNSFLDLINQYKSGQIPGSYVVQGLGNVASGGKARAVSKTTLSKATQAAFDQEQRRQARNKEANNAIDKAAKIKKDRSFLSHLPKEIKEDLEALKEAWVKGDARLRNCSKRDLWILIKENNIDLGISLRTFQRWLDNDGEEKQVSFRF